MKNNKTAAAQKQLSVNHCLTPITNEPLKLQKMYCQEKGKLFYEISFVSEQIKTS
jgi:hypothetical protein